MRLESDHILLDRLRYLLNLFRKYQSHNDSFSAKLILQLKELQSSIRSRLPDDKNDDKSDETQKKALEPFLTILKANNMTGPFKLAAFDCIQYLICYNVISNGSLSMTLILEEIVQAVLRCKIVQTDVTGDEMVQLHMIQTLHLLVTNKINYCLTDKILWDILQNCFSILLSTDSQKSLLVYQEAERTIFETIRFILSQFQDARSGVDNGVENISQQRINALNEVIRYLINILRRYPTDTGSYSTNLSSGAGSSVKVKPSNNSGSGQSANPGPIRPLLSSSFQSFFGEVVLGSEVFFLAFALKSLHQIILGFGDCKVINNILISSPSTARILQDELGLSLLLLCAKRDAYPVSILQLALSIFNTLYNSVGFCIRITIECFMKQIYLKALNQISETLKEIVNSTGETESSLDRTPLKSGGGSFANPFQSNFKAEELEIILESLCDLMSDISFVPTLYASFDCDPTKPDIIQTLVGYLSRSCRMIFDATDDDGYVQGVLNSIDMIPKEVRALVTQAFEQMTKTLTLRSDSYEVYEEQRQKELLKEFYNLKALEISTFSDAEATESRKVVETNDQTNTKTFYSASMLCKLFRSLRQSKVVLDNASKKFVEKPSIGFKYLQSLGILPSPLTPESIANFLRIAPGLPKENAGAYLGELGKDDPSYESDGKIFHQKVLLKYVESFELSGQTVLNCLRIFLSAFRLPGEAQQIDRILVAFSEFCHLNSIEGRNGLLQNAEVTYLLTFSIIMLNTDRHNPNIKDERKMTIEQFIKNNTNYGRDVNQTIPLPRDFLEGIYHSISEFPIRTERNEISSNITPEVWIDLQMQASVCTDKAMMFTTSLQYLPYIKRLASKRRENSEPNQNSSQTLWSMFADQGEEISSSTVARKILDSGVGISAIISHEELSEAMSGLHWLLDGDFVESVWDKVLKVGVSVFVSNYRAIRSLTDPQYDKNGTILSILEMTTRTAQNEKKRRLHLQSSCMFLLALLKTANFFKMHYLVDTIIFLLMEFTGILKGDFFEKLLIEIQKPDEQPDLHRTKIPQSDTIVREDEGTVLDRLSNFSSCRFALLTLLQIILDNQCKIKNYSVIWVALGLLRDLSILPHELVILDSTSEDLLPESIRFEFEQKLESLNFQNATKTVNPSQVKRVRKSSSILSFQGLGEALFGGSTNGEDDDYADETVLSDDVSVAMIDQQKVLQFNNQLNLPSTRWDYGYNNSSLGNDVVMQSERDEQFVNCNKKSSRGFESIPLSVNTTTKTLTLEDLRKFAANSNIGQLISDTRFMSENSLELFVSSLIRCVESSDPGYSPSTSAVFSRNIIDTLDVQGNRHIAAKIDLDVSNLSINPNSFESNLRLKYQDDGLSRSDFDSNARNIFYNDDAEVNHPAQDLMFTDHISNSALDSDIKNRIVNLYTRSQFELLQISPKVLSEASKSWLEMVVVEVSLRNRDRFSLIWKYLKSHYMRTLSNQSILLNYVTERRICGLFKISTRMISREQFAMDILETLGQLFVYNYPLSQNSASSSSMDQETSQLNANKTIANQTYEIWSCLTNQIAAGMWMLLTLNVDILPYLPLDQWQIIFRIISVTSGAGSFSAVKSFEAMAWLLHEPRLFAKVPVFCIVGVKPLLKNSVAPISVSTGALNLLLHLHSRLEVLIKNSDETVGENDDNLDRQVSPENLELDVEESETPVLWESCWLPILRAIADVLSDSRKAVREAAANALREALLDRHSDAVPTGLLIEIVVDIVCPAILSLREYQDEDSCGVYPESRETANSTDRSELLQETMDSQYVVIDTPFTPVTPVTVDNTEQQTEGVAIPKRGGHIIIQCLDTLNDLLVANLIKLVQYPSFDKMWLRILYVFGCFIGEKPNVSLTDQSESSSTHAASRPTDQPNLLQSTLIGRIQYLLKAFKAESIFVRKEGLRIVTLETLKSHNFFSEFEELLM